MDKKIISDVILNCSTIGPFSTDLLKNFLTLREGKPLDVALAEKIWVNQSDFLFFGEKKYNESEFKEWLTSMETLFGGMPYDYSAFTDRIREVGNSSSWFASDSRETEYLSFWLESELLASDEASHIFDWCLKENNTHPLLTAFRFEKYEWCDTFLSRRPDLLERMIKKENKKSSSITTKVQEMTSVRDVLFEMVRTKEGVDWLLRKGVNKKDFLSNVANHLEVDKTVYCRESSFSFKEWSSVVRAFPQEMGESGMLERFLSDFLNGQPLDLKEPSKYKRFENEQLAASFYSPLAVLLDFRPDSEERKSDVERKLRKVRESFGDAYPPEVEATLTHFYLKMDPLKGGKTAYPEEIKNCFNKPESFKKLVELSFLKSDNSFLRDRLEVPGMAVIPSQILMVKGVYESFVERAELSEERNYTAFKWLNQLAFNGLDLSERESFSGVLKDTHTLVGRRLLVDLFQKWASIQPKDFLSLHLAQYTSKAKYSPIRNCEMNEFLVDLLRDGGHKLYPETVEWLKRGLDVAKDLSQKYGPIYEMIEKRILLTQNKETATKTRKFL